MPDIKVTVSDAGERAERAVTTGTKAWELFSETPTVIAARVDGDLKDLAYELVDGDAVEGQHDDGLGQEAEEDGGEADEGGDPRPDDDEHCEVEGGLGAGGGGDGVADEGGDEEGPEEGQPAQGGGDDAGHHVG